MTDLREQIAKYLANSENHKYYGDTDFIIALVNQWLEEQGACKPTTSQLVGTDVITRYGEPLRIS